MSGSFALSAERSARRADQHISDMVEWRCDVVYTAWCWIRSGPPNQCTRDDSISDVVRVSTMLLHLTPTEYDIVDRL